MIGGEEEQVAHLDPILRTIAPGEGDRRADARPNATRGTAPDGYLHCGPNGAGHFVKMVHNGIEYGMMAAIAEGLSIIEHADAGPARAGGRRRDDAAARPAVLPATKSTYPRWPRSGVAARWSARGSWTSRRPRSRGPPTSTSSAGRVSDSGEGRWTVHRVDRGGRSGAGHHAVALRALRVARARQVHRQAALGDAQRVRRPRGEGILMARTEDRADVALREGEKGVAARAAAELVEDGMLVGLGTGTTVAHLLPALAERSLDIRCVATSPETERAALEPRPGRRAVRRPDAPGPRDRRRGPGHAGALADQGRRRRAHAREDRGRRRRPLRRDRRLEQARRRHSHRRCRWSCSRSAVAARLRASATSRRRDVGPSPDGGVIADYLAGFGDPAALADRLSGAPGVVEHGLFPPAMVTAVAVGRDDEVEWLARA